MSDKGKGSDQEQGSDHSDPSSPSLSLFDFNSPKNKSGSQEPTAQGPSLMEQLIQMERAQAKKRPKKTYWTYEAIEDNDPPAVKETIAVKADEGEDAEPEKPKDSGTKAKRPSVSGPKKSAQDRKWEAPFVFTNEKSPLDGTVLRDLLLLPGAWEILTKEQQHEILASFPDDSQILDAGTDKARPDVESLRNDDNFRNDCARYIEGLKLGHHDEDWLAEAWTAHQQHIRGDFDDHISQKFQDDWGVEIPEEHKPKRIRKSTGSVMANTTLGSVADDDAVDNAAGHAGDDNTENAVDEVTGNIAGNTSASKKTALHTYDSPAPKDQVGSEQVATPTTMSATRDNLTRLKQLTLDTPPGSDAGSPTADSPSALKRKRSDDLEVGSRKVSITKLGRQGSSLSISSTLVTVDSAAPERDTATFKSFSSSPGADKASAENPASDTSVNSAGVDTKNESLS